MPRSPLRNLLNQIVDDNFPFGSLPEWVNEIQFYETMRTKVTNILLDNLAFQKQKGPVLSMVLSIQCFEEILVPLRSVYVKSCTVQSGKQYVVDKYVINELEQM